MICNYRNISLLFVIVISGCTSSGKSGSSSNVLPASALHPVGRTIFNEKDGLELISSASHMGFSFTGDECKIYATINDPSGHNYLQYELDGVYQKRIKIEGRSNEPITITTNGDGRHTIWLYKATEAQTGPIFIKQIVASNIKEVEKPTAPVIEFIGNSITCGAAADPSEVPCGTGQYHDQHNAYMAYGPRVARALHTNFLLSSVSGYGIYRNWNSDGPPLPSVYEDARLNPDDSTAWDFTEYNPAIVSIALGTNDYSDGDGKKFRLPFDSATFVNRYILFVQLVKSKYPGSQILLLSSPMIGGARREVLQNCISAVKASIDQQYPTAKPVQVYFFRQMKPSGCSGHPSVDDHALLAEELVPVYRRLL
ncbi:MAG: GDSL-type esterase/lipase family protein [Chitinophagaceae bacterium]